MPRANGRHGPLGLHGRDREGPGQGGRRAPRPPVLTRHPGASRSSGERPRVSTLELFFDLVFVFTITQVTRLVAHAHDARDLGRALLVLALTWWMYNGYAWLTNNVDPDRTGTRLLLLAAMAGFLLMALGVPRAAGGLEADGLAFGLAYLGVVLVHAALFTRAPHASARAVARVAPFNVLGALLVIAAAFAPPAWTLPLWCAALLAPLAAPLARAEQEFALHAGHYAERHGTVILIALGESVVDIGAGAGALPVRAPLAGAAVLGLALAAAIWWSYFDGDDARAADALERADSATRVRLGARAYGGAHLVMLAGVVGAAAGVEGVIAGLTRPAGAPGAAAWLLAAGVAVYLAGDVLFRRLMRLGPSRLRLAAAALALATAPVGQAAGGRAQLAALVALLVGMLAAERPRGAARARAAAVGA